MVRRKSGEDSPWTSLEVTRVLMSAATPLALFVLGYIVSQTDSERVEKREAAAIAREAKSKANALEREKLALADARAREDKIRADGIARDDRNRREAIQRENALKAEAFANQVALKRESDARDLALRREARRESRLDMKMARRIDVWDRAVPILAQLSAELGTEIAHARRIIAGGESQLKNPDATFNKVAELNFLIEANLPYFSPEFTEKYFNFWRAARNLIDQAHKAEPQPRMLDAALEAYEDEYESLRDQAALDLRLADADGE